MKLQLGDTAQCGEAATKGARVCDQLCSAQRALGRFFLSLPTRNEWGESRREGKSIKTTSSPQPSPPFMRRRGRRNMLLCAKQIRCRTLLVCDPQELCPPGVLTNPPRRSLSTCCGSQSRAPGARVCDSQPLRCQKSVRIGRERLENRACCGSQSRAPQ